MGYRVNVIFPSVLTDNTLELDQLFPAENV